MPTISVFFGITIHMYWRDHAPPHFHVVYGEHDAGTMSTEEDPKADSATGIVPRPNPQSDWRVAAVECLEGFRLRVRFRDGTIGDVRMRQFLQDRTVDGTVFEALREPRMFSQAGVELGAVTWPNGADLAPDAMYDEIRANGFWEVPSD